MNKPSETGREFIPTGFILSHLYSSGLTMKGDEFDEAYWKP